MKTIAAIFLLLLITGTAYAEDEISPFFEKIDDLLLRVDSGISLNSFAKTYSGRETGTGYFI